MLVLLYDILYCIFFAFARNYQLCYNFALSNFNEKEFFMAYLNLVTYPDGRLREICRDVDVLADKDQVFIDDMIDTMIYNKGVGLAAPQVGRLENIIVVSPKVSKKEVFVYINPIITKQVGSVSDVEGCLSVPCASGDVIRASEVEVEALDRDGNKISFSATDFYARIIQHEIDHLRGKLFIDHLGFSARKKAVESAKRAKEL